MKKKLITYIVFLMIAAAVLAEKSIDKQIADLEKKLPELSRKEKVEALNKMALIVFQQSPKKCIAFANQALELAKKIEYTGGEARALKALGIGYGVAGEYEESLKYSRRALKVYEKLGDRKGIGYSLNNIANIYSRLNNYVKALEYHKQTLVIMKETGNKNGIAMSLTNLGLIHTDRGDYDQGLKYCLDALKIREELNHTHAIADVHYLIGRIYIHQKKYNKAVEHFNPSLKIYKQSGNNWGMSTCLQGIGIAHLDLGDYDRALSYLRQSLKISEENQYNREIAYSLDNIGQVYEKLKNYNEAIRYYLKSLTITREIGDQFVTADLLYSIGRIQTEIKNYNAAFSNFSQGLKIAKEIETKELIKDGYRYFSSFYAAKGDYKNAFHYHQQYAQLNEKIYNEKSSQQIAEMQTQYETEKKEMEIQALKKETQVKSLKNKVQMVIAVSLIAVLIMILIIIYRYYKHYRDELKHKNEMQKSLQLEGKLKLFQARINPHFLFNSLNSIIGLGNEGNPGKLKETIKKLSNIYQSILSSPDTFTVPLEKELEVVRNYIEVEKRILCNPLDFKISISNEELLSTEIIPQSILTLVENAVKHGISKKEEGGTIAVHIYHEDQSVIIEIIDTGIGFDMGSVKPGFGLYSIQERLKLFYKGKARFRIGNLSRGGTRAVMQIPYQAA